MFRTGVAKKTLTLFVILQTAAVRVVAWTSVPTLEKVIILLCL